MEILFLVVGLVLGFAIAYLFLRGKQNTVADTSIFESRITELDRKNVAAEASLNHSRNDNQRLEQELRQLREQFAAELNASREKYLNELNLEKDKLSKAESRIARAEEIFKSQEERNQFLKAELEALHKKHTVEFENMANKILEEKSNRFTEQNKSNLDVILNPLKEKIKSFEEKVESTYKAESAERITLKTEIRNLVELNQKISDEANNLAKALKGENKKQGNWGELILEKVLERSGLVKDQEYRLQFSTSNDEGKRIQPDAVIMLPDNKHVIVDSKVSLVAYEAFCSAATDEDRDRCMKDHLLSVRNHVRQLSEKNYQSSLDFNTPDFVLLFIPIESSFSVAVQADQELFGFAWDKKIVIVSPSTLLATLRTIASIWKQERQTRNAIEIAKQSGALYDKFVGFIEDMEKMGKNIDASKTAYESAMNKLHKGSGNLVKRAQDIEKLGAKTTKQLSQKFLESEETVKDDSAV
jgi:DNA recombination protein RmuC